MKARRTKSRGPKLLVVITRGLIRSIKHSTFCLEQYELYEGFQRGWEVRVGGGKEDSNCTVSASVPMKSHSQQQGGVMLGTVLLMLYCIYILLQNGGRAGWTQETVGPGSGHYYCLLLPTHPPPTTTTLHLCTLCSPIKWPQLTLCCCLLCTLKAQILLSCTSKYFSYNATNPLPLALTPQH